MKFVGRAIGESHGCAAVDFCVGDDAIERGLVRRREVALVDVFDEDPFDRAVPAAACGNASFFEESDRDEGAMGRPSLVAGDTGGGRDVAAEGVDAKPA